MFAQFGPASWVLCGLSAAAAILYGLVLERKPPSFFRALVKAAFLTTLAGAFALAQPHVLFVHTLLPWAIFVAALLAAALGDFLLAFDKPWVLPLGMIAFLIMQALYIITFLGRIPDMPNQPEARLVMAALIGLVVIVYLIWFWREPRTGRNPLLALLAIAGAFAIGGAPVVIALTGRFGFYDVGRMYLAPSWMLASVILIAAIFFMWLRRDLGAVKLAGMVYAAVILQMAFVSLWLPWSGWPVMLGAFFFLISDGVLSAELFRLAPEAKARALTGPVVWWTYAFGQALIAFGVARLA
ncbi:MAG: lysoplasmalogenase family protein [Terricaulis silvestris]